MRFYQAKKSAKRRNRVVQKAVNSPSLVPLQFGRRCRIASTVPTKHIELADQETFVLVKSALLQNQITLYKALGGGLAPAP